MDERLAERIARVTCTSNKEFVLEALTQGIRADGRGCDDCRPRIISPAAHGAGCQVEVQCGRTRVLASVNSCIVEPYPDKPNKGIVTFGVKLDWCALILDACLHLLTHPSRISRQRCALRQERRFGHDSGVAAAARVHQEQSHRC